MSDEGLLTGRFVSLAFGSNKAARVREWAEAHGVSLSSCAFYSDSFADRTLLSEVGFPVCVNPDRRLRKLAALNGWPIQDWGKSSSPVLPMDRWEWERWFKTSPATAVAAAAGTAATAAAAAAAEGVPAGHRSASAPELVSPAANG